MAVSDAVYGRRALRGNQVFRSKSRSISHFARSDCVAVLSRSQNQIPRGGIHLVLARPLHTAPRGVTFALAIAATRDFIYLDVGQEQRLAFDGPPRR